MVITEASGSDFESAHFLPDRLYLLKKPDHRLIHHLGRIEVDRSRRLDIFNRTGNHLDASLLFGACTLYLADHVGDIFRRYRYELAYGTLLLGRVPDLGSYALHPLRGCHDQVTPEGLLSGRVVDLPYHAGHMFHGLTDLRSEEHTSEL